MFKSAADVDNIFCLRDWLKVACSKSIRFNIGLETVAVVVVLLCLQINLGLFSPAVVAEFVSVSINTTLKSQGCRFKPSLR